MRVRWGGSGFDDLKCTQLTSYSYSAQLLRQFNGFVSVLLMLTCQGVSAGPTNCSISSTELLHDLKTSHHFYPSPPAAKIYNYSYHITASLRKLMTSSEQQSPACGEGGVLLLRKEKKEAVAVQKHEHISIHVVYFHSTINHLSHCNYDKRKEIAGCHICTSANRT